jgi:hypothetical protein
MTHASILDVHMRVELQRIVNRLTGRGDAVLAAILTSAVNTLDHRLDLFEDQPAAAGSASDEVALIEPVIRLFGRDLRIMIERDFWLLFVELVNGPTLGLLEALERSLDRRPEETLASRVVPAIRLLVLHTLLERETVKPEYAQHSPYLHRLAG